MIRLLVFTSVLCCTSTLLCHPLHLSVASISRDENGLDITLRTFVNDWETAYFHFHGNVLDLGTLDDPDQERHPWFDQYLQEHFRLSGDEEESYLQLGVETIRFEDEESMVIELRAELPENTDSLRIYNILLTDIFPDQKNLVIFGSGKDEIGIEFDARKVDHAVSLK